MEIEDLPEEVQEEIDGLKHGSLTIETEVLEALEKAKNIEEFEKDVESRMEKLIADAEYAIDCFGKTEEKDKNEMVMHAASGFTKTICGIDFATTVPIQMTNRTKDITCPECKLILNIWDTNRKKEKHE